MILRSTLTSAIAAFAVSAVPVFAQTAQPAPAAPAPAYTVPMHNCVAPSYPTKAQTAQLKGDAYNKVIDKFNADYKAYGECIKKYVEDTKTLLKEIAEAGNKAIEEYNKYTTDLKQKIEEEKQ